MKKLLLSLAVAVSAVTLSAQELWMAPDIIFSKVSEDGNLLLMSDGEGTLYLYHKDIKEFEIFEAEMDLEGNYSPWYTEGFGNIFAEDGTMVGNYDDASPAYMKDGEWYLLPIDESDAEIGKINAADGITPDGSRICGGIAISSFGIDANEPMEVPVLWQKNAAGEYDHYIVLPHPEKDFAGRTPQYITARSISDDGKTIVGQITEWSGNYILPIVYREDAAGEWSYEVLGASMVYDENATFPQYPTYEPKQPKAEDYLDETSYAAYYNAYQAYQDSVDAYYSGTINEWPSYYPKAKDFLTGEAAETFANLLNTYQEEYAAYSDSCDVFDEIFYDPSVVYGTSFEFNNVYLSRDGKYLASTFKQVDPDGDPFSWFPSYLRQGCRFNLTNAEAAVELTDLNDCLVTSIMNDGSLLVATPADEYTRNTYVVAPNQTAGVALDAYILEKDPEVGEYMKEIMTFTGAAYDEDWNLVPGEERVWTGTAISNGVGNVFVGWMYNQFIDEDLEWSALSFIAVLNENTTKLGSLQSRVSSAVVTDLSGRVVNTTGSLKELGKGVYMVTTTNAAGETKTMKVIKH